MTLDEKQAITDALLAITGAILKIGPHLPPQVNVVVNQDISVALQSIQKLVQPPPSKGNPLASLLYPDHPHG